MANQEGALLPGSTSLISEIRQMMLRNRCDFIESSLLRLRETEVKLLAKIQYHTTELAEVRSQQQELSSKRTRLVGQFNRGPRVATRCQGVSFGSATTIDSLVAGSKRTISLPPPLATKGIGGAPHDEQSEVARGLNHDERVGVDAGTENPYLVKAQLDSGSMANGSRLQVGRESRAGVKERRRFNVISPTGQTQSVTIVSSSSSRCESNSITIPNVTKRSKVEKSRPRRRPTRMLQFKMTKTRADPREVARLKRLRQTKLTLSGHYR